MARTFNGSSDKGSVALNLSSFSVVSISCWLWWDAFANDNKMLFEYGSTTLGAGTISILPDNASPVGFALNFGLSTTGGQFWQDTFTRPSAAAWHHYLFVMNRATPSNAAWVDGVSQTLTAGTHFAGSYGNFGNLTLNIMCRNGTTLFGKGRLAEMAIWGGVALGTSYAKSLAAGSSPSEVDPTPTWYVPTLGNSPEPDYSGNRKSVTITGTTVVAHPGVRPWLMGLGRGFQPMPV